MKVVITGGAGYVGFSLIDNLLKINDKVSEIVVFDNLSRRNLNFFFAPRMSAGRIKFVEADILDNSKINKILEGCDLVYHLAAKVITPFAEGDFHQFDQINNWGTGIVANAIERNAVPHAVYLSSQSVYAPTAEPVSESSLVEPSTNYGVSKKRGEDHLLRLAGRTHLQVIRSGNVYGFNPCLRTDAVINNFVFKAHFGQKLHLHGDGQQRRAFIHVEKIGAALAGLSLEKTPVGVFNLAEHNFSILEILDLIKQVYPRLEYRFVNPEFTFRSMEMLTPVRLWEFVGAPASRSFLEEIEDFQKCFSI
jgi:UDP-glucose 4-epimerase